jgi:hypothetical protein
MSLSLFCRRRRETGMWRWSLQAVIDRRYFRLNISGQATRQRPLHVWHSGQVCVRRLVHGQPAGSRVNANETKNGDT